MVTNQRSSYRRNQAKSTETWQSLPMEKNTTVWNFRRPDFRHLKLNRVPRLFSPFQAAQQHAAADTREIPRRQPSREESTHHRPFKGRVSPTEMMMSRAWRVPTLPQSMGAPSYRLPLHQEQLGHRGAIEASDWPCSWPHGHDALGAGFFGRKSSRLPSHCQEPHGSSLDRNLKLDPWRFQASPASTTTIAMTRTGASNSMGEPGAGGFSIGNF